MYAKGCRAEERMRFKRFSYGIILLLVFFVFLFCLEDGDDVYTRMRKEMVKTQLADRDITDAKVLDIMGRVPRHLFVGPRYRSQAYSDHPLPIDEGQTISQPYIVALMTQHLRLKPGEKVLEVGTGSGYQAAVLAHLTDEVYSIEIRENLAKKASETLEQLNYSQVKVKWDDGYFGWKEFAPFDCIIVTCATNHVPPPLLDQLNEGGRLIIPLGSTLYFQTLTLITKVKGKPQVKHILGVRFVPMTGEAQKKRGEEISASCEHQNKVIPSQEGHHEGRDRINHR
jgi:protein-L-isoaspartate(D-aspartate) O-methyltransferase